MAHRPGIFPTFFLSGFECSTFLWKDGKRRNLIAETQHDRHAREDYAVLRSLGIAVAREAIPWPLVESAGHKYEFSLLDPLIEAMNEAQVLPIWDLCHYGYPDHLDPYAPWFKTAFAAYCQAAAEYVIPRVRGPHYFTPINEITFWSFSGAEWSWCAPFGRCREDRFRFREILCEAAIAGVHAIREVHPGARMIHMEPLVQVVAPVDRPDLEAAAWRETWEDTYLAWDILAGIQHPEYGGSPDVLDIVGANNYSFGQMEYREQGPHQALDPNDPRIVPLCDLLKRAWERYRRPMIISETSGLREGREDWLRDVMEESLAAVAEGMDLHGICLFPAVDMPDWHTGEWLHNGICDLVFEGETLRRQPYQPYIDELRRWQERLNRVTVLDDDPLSDPVDLEDVIRAAQTWTKRPDKDWH